MQSRNFKPYKLSFFGCVVALLALSAMARAQTFVSAQNGVDAGTCSLNAPCRNIAYALTQTVEGSAVTIIDSGSYAPFAVNKSVTVQAAPGVTAIITRNSVGPGVTIEAQGTEYITIRGLTLILPNNLFSPGTGGVSVGFSMTGGGTVAIERCIVRGFLIGVEAKMIGQLLLRDTQLSGGTTGIHVNANYLALRVNIERCAAARYETGLQITTSPGAVMRATVIESQFLASTFGVKIAPEASGTISSNFASCTLANNRTGLSADGAGATIRVSDSTITDNGFGLVSTTGATLLSRGDNTVEGNSNNGSFTANYSAK